MPSTSSIGNGGGCNVFRYSTAYQVHQCLVGKPHLISPHAYSESVMSSQGNRPRILCFVAYYLPGYLAGGPIRTIANFVEQLGNEFEILIVTRDRDMLGTEQYPDVKVGDWNKVGNAQVFYAPKKSITLTRVARLLRNTPHDLLYVNSFFDPSFTGLPLLARHLGMAPSKPCVIAPRGEFSQGAIALKATKKRVYISLVKALSLYNNLHWQASSDYEREDICRRVGSIAKSVHIAPNLTSVFNADLHTVSTRAHGSLRLIFLSRISPMKNLDFLLRVLARVSANVELAIYGPQEDAFYWEKCKDLIKQLPENIHVTVGGQIPQAQVRDVFAKHDMFVFPSRGENFGHVIFESLTVGTPVLVSDQTPWRQDARCGLEVLPLDESLWGDAIVNLARLDQETLARRRSAAVEFASVYAVDNMSLRQNRQLFRLALGEN